MKKLLFAALFSASFIPALALAAEAPPTAAIQPAVAPRAAPTTVAQAVVADFPTYDIDKSGALSNAEFDSWMIAAKKQSGAAMPDGEWLAKAFTKADSDANETVSATELTAFLSA